MRLLLPLLAAGALLMTAAVVPADEKFGPSELFEKKSFQAGGVTLPYRLLKPALEPQA